MKLRIGIVVLACALGACKDKKAATNPAEPAPCVRTAAHTTKVMQSEMGDSLAEEDWPKLTAALEQRCTEDKWAAEVMACMDGAVTGPAFDACADQLTEEQNAAVKAQFERDIVPLMKPGSMKKKDEAMGEGDGAAAPKSAPPPPDDPCGGDE